MRNRLLTLCVTDIDGDGKNEIIAGSEDKHIYILDTEGNMIWRHNHKNRVFSIFAYDTDNDGLPELLVGAEHKRVRLMRIRLRRGIEKKIYGYYRQLGRPDPLMIAGLTTDQRVLLQDVLRLNGRELVTFEQAEEQMKAGDYQKALSTLLRLEEQKVEQLWNKKNMGYIRSVCFRHTANELKREIIVGTSDGGIYAFYVHGRRAWFTHLNDHILDVQTGYIDHQKQEEIVICSSGRHVYILGSAKKQKQRDASIDDAWMLSICVLAPSMQSQPEIIIGSEDKKLSIYGNDLQKPVATITTKEGVRIVRAHTPLEENMPEIVVASLGNGVYAYRRNGNFLWDYKTRDHIRSVCIKDINNDGKAEILIGSEDRNLHVLDSAGRLLWRYYLPHTVLAVDAADADQDDMVEVFAGCADGSLYVFNRDGDLLWTYQTKDRIHAVRVEDIDGDGNVEIAIGSEDEFELLRVVNQQRVTTAINRCWIALSQQYSEYVIEHVLNLSDPYLQAFALGKLAERDKHHPKDFDIFEKFATEGTPEVRQKIAHLMLSLYPSNPSRIQPLLHQLSIDNDLGVRNVIIEHLPTLMQYDWEQGFIYLKRASENPSRFVRRMAVRKLYELIDTSAEGSVDRRHEIFALLLTVAQDNASEWVQQEAARTLAHFLDQHQGSLIVYIHLFIVKGLQPHFWEQFAYATTNVVARRYISTLVPMLSGLDESNVPERLQQMISGAKRCCKSSLRQRYPSDLH